MNFLVTFQNGPDAGTRLRLELGQTYSIGRAPDVKIRLPADDNLASRYHATLTPMRDGVELVDLRSRNGTYVEGVRLERALLQHGERLRVGRTEMMVSAEDEHDTLPGGPPELSDLPGSDSEDQAALEWALPSPTSREPPRLLEQAPCQGCGALGEAPGGRFLDAPRLCARCATARRSGGPRLPERIGPYQIVRAVGQGGAGAVYEARHSLTDAQVALKALLPESPLDRSSVARFLREQRVAMTLSHPRIVRCYDVGEDPARALLYIANEWLPGGDAEALCSPSLPREVALSLAADLFEALAYLHQRGFIHRDVKPGNLLLVRGPKGLSGRLADFGIIKNARDTGSRLTMDSDVGGTPLYVSPEQLLDFKWVGRTADLYSAAASLYGLLTGASPLPLADTSGQMAHVVVYNAVLEDRRVPIRERRSEVPLELAEWIDLAVARSPAGRETMDAAEIAAWLRRIARAPW